MRLIPALLLMVAAAASPLPDGPGLAARMEARQTEVKGIVRDLTVVQKVTVTTGEATTVNEVTAYVKGEKSRTEIVATNPAAPATVPEAYKRVTSLIIGDGKEKWSHHSIRGVQRIEGGHDGPKGLGERLAAGVRVEGEERLHGRDCWKIAYEAEGTPVRLWLDRRDFFPVRQEWSEEGIAVVQYSDTFAATGVGVDIPTRTVTMRGGEQAAVTVVESVAVNSGLADDLFDLDEVRRRAVADPPGEGIVARVVRRIKVLLGME